MSLLERLAMVLQRLFSESTEVAAASSELCQKEGKLKPQAFARGLVFGWMQQPDATMELLNSFVRQAGTAFSVPALSQRLTAEASGLFFLALLKAALEILLTTPQGIAPILSRFSGVYLFDSSQLTLPACLAQLWPGSGGDNPHAGLKILARLELLAGSLALELAPARLADTNFDALKAPLPKGALRLADLGFFDLDRLAQDSLRGVYWVTRAQPHTLVSLPAQAQKQLWRYLQDQQQSRLEEWVELGPDRLRCRMLAWRCPQEVEARRRQKAKASARRHGRTLSKRQAVMCGWTVLFTNAPEEKLAAKEGWIVYRLRWQIELLFKRWKSLGRLSHSRGTNPRRVLLEVYAKLLGVVVSCWLTLLGSDWYGRLSWAAYREVGSWGRTLLRALGKLDRLVEALADLAFALEAFKGTQRRSKGNAQQTLEEPDSHGPRGP